MKTLKFTLLLSLALTTLISCGGIGKQTADAKGFAEVEKEIKSKFGENAYFTDLMIVNVKSLGLNVSLTVTEDPESLKMEEWHHSQSMWTQDSEITLEVSKGSNVSDFMFQLNTEINLAKLGELIEKSKKQLTAEKSIENPRLEMAYIKFPDNGDISEAKYAVTLEPKDGGTSYNFYYKLNGEFIEMNY